MRRLLPLLVLLAALGLTSCATRHAAQRRPRGEHVGPGEPWPAFSVTRLDGTRAGSDDFRGSPAVVVFFHTGCSDCRRELPVVEQLYREYGSRVPFLCIGRAQDSADVARFWEEQGLTLPVAPQTDKSVFRRFADHTIPRIYVGDADGTVRHIFVERTTRRKLRKALRSVAPQAEQPKHP